jgi:hypothetical protein
MVRHMNITRKLIAHAALAAGCLIAAVGVTATTSHAAPNDPAPAVQYCLGGTGLTTRPDPWNCPGAQTVVAGEYQVGTPTVDAISRQYRITLYMDRRTSTASQRYRCAHRFGGSYSRGRCVNVDRGRV